MRLSSATVYGRNDGYIIVNLSDGSNMTIQLTEQESAILRASCERIVEARQEAMAKAVSESFVALADFSETY